MVTRLTIMLVVALLLVSCSNNEEAAPSDLPMTETEQLRLEKDEYFRDGEHSPIPEDQRDGFVGLNYFPIDSAFVVAATFVPNDDPQTFKMATTQNDLRDAFRAGTLTFTIDGTPCTLTAYQFVGQNDQSLFVPFKDATSGAETYGTGRYIDLEYVRGSLKYEIDFNVAYNPYCAYNENYSCPLTPAENTLPVAIKAGEKAWEAH